jgi:hypothetical protein
VCSDRYDLQDRVFGFLCEGHANALVDFVGDQIFDDTALANGVTLALKIAVGFSKNEATAGIGFKEISSAFKDVILVLLLDGECDFD